MKNMISRFVALFTLLALLVPSGIAESGSAKNFQRVCLGSFEQDGNFDNGSESIGWYVIGVDGNRALLLAEKGLIAGGLHNEREYLTWADWSCRDYLNNSFYMEAFSEVERACILDSNLDADNNPNYGTSGGSSTTDHVFVPSYSELGYYLDYEEIAYASVTDYAASQGAFRNDQSYGWWWLRTPGNTGRTAMVVLQDGSIKVEGSYIDWYENVIRPAVWVDVDKFNSINRTSSPEAEFLDYEEGETSTKYAVVPRGIDASLGWEPKSDGATFILKLLDYETHEQLWSNSVEADDEDRENVIPKDVLDQRTSYIMQLIVWDKRESEVVLTTFDEIPLFIVDVIDDSVMADYTMGIKLSPTVNSIYDIALIVESGDFSDQIVIGEYYAGAPDGFTYDLWIYKLQNNKLLIEERTMLDGISHRYIIVDISDRALSYEKYLINPGYSSGYGLKDELNDTTLLKHDELEYTDINSKYMDCLDLSPDDAIEYILNREFEEYAIDFLGDHAILHESHLMEHFTEEDFSEVEDFSQDNGSSTQQTTGASTAHTIGNVNIRSGPGLAYNSVGNIANGRTVRYLGNSAIDDRGVAWYNIEYNGTIGWVSSKYVVVD